MKETLQIIAENKRTHRQVRARLSFPEKIQILVNIQKRRAPIMKLRGKTQRIWEIDPPFASEVERYGEIGIHTPEEVIEYENEDI